MMDRYLYMEFSHNGILVVGGKLESLATVATYLHWLLSETKDD
jgi:hypothetical protein